MLTVPQTAVRACAGKDSPRHWSKISDCATTIDEEGSCRDLDETDEELEGASDDEQQQTHDFVATSDGAEEWGEEECQRRQLEARLALQLQKLGSEQLVAALAKVLEHLVALDCEGLRPTIFHCSRAPQVSILEYLTRIQRYFQCSDACLVLGLLYMDRLSKISPDLAVSRLNVHRMLATSVVLAVKYLDDIYYSNTYYARVAGLALQDLNRLEAGFLKLVGWRMHVAPDEFEQYVSQLLLLVTPRVA